MTGDQLAAARATLGRTVREMAYDLAVTEAEIRAWEAAGADLIPLRQARDVRLFLAEERQIAELRAEGIAECPRVVAWQNEPMPDKLDEQVARIRWLERHEATCRACQAARHRMEELWPGLVELAPPPSPPARTTWLGAASRLFRGRGQP